MSKVGSQSMEHKLGVDLGGTKIAVAALDAENRAVFRQRAPTPSADYGAIVRLIRDLVAAARGALGLRGDLPVGVGIPGALGADDVTVKNANTQILIGKPLRRDLAEALGAPVAVANDATCFIASEAADGAAAGAASAYGVIIGTGVGGGIAFGGRPVIGRNRLCGEWGHNPFPLYGRAPWGRACYCGKTDCIEQILSGPGLARSFAEAVGPAESGAGQAKTAQEIAALAEAGDPAAARVVAAYAEDLARALSTVINLLDPEVIVLGGGLSNIETLYTETPRVWDRFVFNAAPQPTPVTTRLVKNRWGDDSGVRGAAWLTAAMVSNV